MNTVKFGSVCSGIEAASVAWNHLGWEAAWFSEIESFPSKLLAHHYPNVKNLGDMTTLVKLIVSREIEAPDVLCGGTPCQAFSVAGKRESLSDTRGNLTLTFCDIADAIDQIRIQDNEPEAIIFWENVPGILNTSDNAFGCFLGRLSGESEELKPTGGKWTNAGFVLGPKRAIAWRVLDAQYFGVAQRRRRVFVVASARARFDCAKVLFEFDGVRRDTAPSREAGQEVAATLSTGFGSRGVDSDQIANGNYALGTWPAQVAPTLNASFGSKQGLEDQHINGGAGWFVPDVANTLTTQASTRLDVTSDTFVQTYTAPHIGEFSESNLSGTITRNSGGGGETQNAAFVMQTYPINTMTCQGRPSDDLNPRMGVGIGGPNDPSPTLTKAHSHAVAFGVGEKPDIAHYLRSGASKADKHESTTYVAQASHEVDGTMLSRNISGGFSNSIDHAAAGYMAIQQMQVRRLTPVECERLQGFPDGYTDIKPNGKPTPDGPRYKALGNSWAVPVVAWVGRRIDAEIKL